MYSTVLSLPLHAEPTSDKHKKFFETDNWNESDASTSLSATYNTKPKRSLLSESENMQSHPHNTKVLGHESRIRKSKSGAKRGLDIGLKIRLPSTPKYNREMDKLEEVLELAKLNLEGKLEKVLNVSACPQCDEDEIIVPEKRIVKPAYQCDEWDAQYRLCILERNIGDTVTFYLSTGKFEEIKSKVTWKKEFHMRDSKSRTDFLIDPGNPPENIIIGKQGYELRISPVTETDVGYNLFSASLNGHHSAQSTVYFMIRIVPIDLGFVYVGETIELNLRSYFSFPTRSFSFRWYMEKYGEHSTLPSNMRTSYTGSSIKISELRQEQEGVLACSIYTNLNFLATKKRFLMKDLIKNNDVLKSTPNHTLHFEEKNPDRRKRFPKKLIRHKKDISVEDFGKALMESTTEETRTTTSRKPDATTHSYDDYNVGMDVGYPGTTVKPQENLRRILSNSGYEAPPVYPIDIPVEGNPVYVEETGINREIMDKYQDQSVNGIYGGTSMLNDLSEGKGFNQFNQHSREQVLSDVNKMASLQNSIDSNPELSAAQLPSEQVLNDVNKMAPLQNGLGSNPQLAAAQQSFLSKDIYDGDKNIIDIQVQNGGRINGTYTEDSDIILNVEKIRGRRQVTAEEKISKLISFCYSDYECSGMGACTRSNLKQPGYCKCIANFYGVGIFCREDVWISNNNYGMQDFQHPDEVPYPSNLPIIEATE